MLHIPKMGKFYIYNYNIYFSYYITFIINIKNIYFKTKIQATSREVYSTETENLYN